MSADGFYFECSEDGCYSRPDWYGKCGQHASEHLEEIITKAHTDGRAEGIAAERARADAVLVDLWHQLSITNASLAKGVARAAAEVACMRAPRVSKG